MKTVTHSKTTIVGMSRNEEMNPQKGKNRDKSMHTEHLNEFLNKTKFSDDGTTTFLWRSHTFTVLIILLSVLVYVAIFEPCHNDTEYNTKRGIVACMLVFILLGVTVTPDGVFKRPHPTVWRCTFCCSIIYELGLIFMLFQSKPDAISLLKHIDPKLGVPLEEKDYGGNCLIYDTAVLENPFHNVWDKIDLFVPMHFLGWWLKTLVLRDWWLCTVLSIMFEVLEYTLEHQLPNFSECWWDHWIMDALICNGLGIYLGILTLKYYSMKTYHWRGLWKIPTYKGKLQRLVAQFGPYTWIDYDWKSTSSLGRWLATLGIILLFLMTELNTFYLKFVMWVPPSHYFNAVRLVFVLFWGAVGVREGFQYLDDPDCTKIGRQSWMLIAIISTEFLIVAKFDWDTITKPIPKHMLLFWTIGLTVLILWTVWRFFIATSTKKSKPTLDVDQRRLRWDLVRSCELGSSSSTVTKLHIE